VLLFAGTLALFAPSARLGFLYDDYELIVDALPPASPGELARVFAERHWPTLPYYRPIPRASMLVQKALHGDAAGPYHLLNALLAAAAAAAAFALLRQRAFGLPVGLAALGAALFAAHPIASSCVYPVASGRETLWPTLFELLAVLGFVRAGSGAYALALGATAAALLSKEHAVVLPAIFLLADALGMSASAPGRSAAAWLRRHGPVWALLAAYLLVRRAIFPAGSGKLELAFHTDPAGPLLSLLFAVQTAFLPARELVYEPVVGVWVSPARALLALAALGVALAALAQRSTEWRRRALFWSGWTLLGLLPTANLLVQEARFDERYVYFPSLGLAALVVSALAPLWSSPRARLARAAALGLVVAAVAAVSFERARFFADDESFLQQWIATDPDRAQPRLSLAKLALRRNEAGRALAFASQAVERAPRLADAENTRGLAFDALGLSEQAEASYRRAIELAPEGSLAHNNLGVLLLDRGDFAGAAAEFENALAGDPNDVDARINLAIARAQQGDRAAAIAQLERVLAARPRHAAACFNLGAVLEADGALARAREAYRCALDSRPDYALARQRLDALDARLGAAP
jgi:Flp pilus assembly protein TadD